MEPINSNNDKSNKKFSWIIIGSVALLIVVFLLFGFLSRIAQWKQNEALANQNEEISVAVLIVQADKKPTELLLPSTTEGIRYTPIWARVDGYIGKLLVDIGDVVNEGQLLAVIETPETEEQLLQANADLNSALARLEIAQISAKRWQDLYKRNPQAVSSQEVDERTTTLLAATADVKSFQSNVERLEKIISFNQIVAPFQGTITERDIDLGSLITAGSSGSPQQLFTIAKLDVIRVFVNVPQAFFRLISVGQNTKVTIQEYPSVEFTGTVIRTAGALAPLARTLLTEIHIDNRDGRLMPGLYATVRFLLIPDTEYFIIPTSAVIIRNAGPYVAVIDEHDIVTIKPIKLGRDYGKTMQITSGLNENDRVVTNPGDSIQNGVHVHVVSTKTQDQTSP